MLERARALSERMREHAARAERDARVADEVIEALDDSGLLGLFAPRARGGMEACPVDMLEVVAILGEGDASAAWVASFYMAHTWIASLFPAEAQEELVDGRAFVRAPAPFGPIGAAIPCHGGHHLIHAADALPRGAASELMLELEAQEEIPLDDRSRLRLNAAYAVQCALRSLRSLVDSAASSAHFTDHPLQRQLRDVTVIASHAIFDWDATLELRGRMLVGLGPRSPLL